MLNLLQLAFKGQLELAHLIRAASCLHGLRLTSCGRCHTQRCGRNLTPCCGRNHNPCCGAITATAGNSARCHTFTCGRRLPCFFHTLNFSKLDSCATASLTVRRETLHLRWRHTRNCGLARDMEVLERLLQEHKGRLLLHGQQYDVSTTSSPLASSPCFSPCLFFRLRLRSPPTRLSLLIDY